MPEGVGGSDSGRVPMHSPARLPPGRHSHCPQAEEEWGTGSAWGRGGAGALEGPGEEAQPVGTGPAAGRMSTVAEQHGGSGEGQSLRIPTELPSWTRPLTQGSNLPWVTDPP